ncbi:MAG: nitroreductase family protein [Bacteroidota bacterium]
MTFIELAKNRYSSRKYLPEPVEEHKLMYVLEAGRVAPSAANHQPWEFVVIQSGPMLDMIYPVYPREWFSKAPVVIVILGDHSQSWKRAADGKDHCDIDMGITVDHMTLAATESGLGTCWICNFNAQLCKSVLKLPEHIEPMVILSLGYPADQAEPERHKIRRKAIQDIVHWEVYNNQ